MTGPYYFMRSSENWRRVIEIVALEEVILSLMLPPWFPYKERLLKPLPLNETAKIGIINDFDAVVPEIWETDPNANKSNEES